MARLPRRHGFDLLAQIRRSVDYPPTLRFFGVAADGDTRLTLRIKRSLPCRHAVGTGTIPLRQAAPCRTTENVNANQPKFSPESLFNQTAPAYEVHSKKIGTLFSVGLIHRFFVLMNC